MSKRNRTQLWLGTWTATCWHATCALTTLINCAADFWLTAIHSAYATGLRRGDLLRVLRTEIGPNGICKIVQHKTGYPVWLKFPQPALDAMQRMPADVERAVPWPYHDNAMARRFRELVKQAEVRPGQFRCLRRSAGSYADAECPGAGARLLGHRDDRVFHRHYEIAGVTRSQPVEPPPLA